MAYATIDQLKRLLGITVNSDDVLLAETLARAQAVIDSYTNRRFEAVTKTVTLYTVDRSVLGLADDVLSVTSVVNGDGTTLTASEYAPAGYSYPTRALIKLVGNWIAPVEVTGQFGYSASAPADIVQAALRLAAWMYRQKDAQVFDVSGSADMRMTVRAEIPSDVTALLDRYTWPGDWT